MGIRGLFWGFFMVKYLHLAIKIMISNEEYLGESSNEHHFLLLEQHMRTRYDPCL